MSKIKVSLKLVCTKYTYIVIVNKSYNVRRTLLLNNLLKIHIFVLLHES